MESNNNQMDKIYSLAKMVKKILKVMSEERSQREIRKFLKLKAKIIMKIKLMNKVYKIKQHNSLKTF